MRAAATGAALLAIVFTGAIFGFFYAWVCSTMWGLDAIDPRHAIAAMQGMNASVRNGVFALAFFGTPFVLALAAGLAFQSRMRRAALLLALAAAIYLGFGLVLTLRVNVPMNEALARIAIPEDVDEARAIWSAYSGPWQTWNVVRTLASGLSLVLTALGLRALSRAEQ